MSSSVVTGRSKLVSFLKERLDDDPLLLTVDADDYSPCEAFSEFACRHQLDDQISISSLVRSCLETRSPIGVCLAAGRTLVVAQITGANSGPLALVSVQAGPLKIACQTVRNAIESWNLTCDLSSSRKALDESAMQLAQSFEEQNWLRGFARNASSLSRRNTANDMASGILQPLGYLLRAQDVFLIVDPEEHARSGLTDTKFGASQFSIQTVRELLKELHIGSSSRPLVMNNTVLQTADGLVRSLIVVSIVGLDDSLGHLVGINRATDQHVDGLPVYDPEFGSGDVGLLEEAAVLLSTQAHNIHLLVRSNQLFLGTLHAMSSAIDARDKYTQGHSERVARLSFDLARLYGLSEEACQEIYLAGILHDVGKIGIPDSVLLKNGPLTDDEFKIIQQHPEIGYRIVERLGHLQFVLPGVLYHHERIDGQGYPHGLQAESIPLMARIMAVADAFDAMTSSRPYRNAMPVDKAQQIIKAGSGTQWDSQAVDCFRLWFEKRTMLDAVPLLPNQSIIPQDSPVEYIAQAVLALGH